jgi:hypothetical protein
MKGNIIKSLLQKCGYDIIKLNKPYKWPTDFESRHKEIVNKTKSFTMTSPERIFGLIEAVRYIIHNGIEGDIVECGVWKGGSMLAVAETLISEHITNRNLYLYDTFEGMSEPTEADVNPYNDKAELLLQSNVNKEENIVWAYSGIDEVKTTLNLSSYPKESIHFIKGKVEETIPKFIPEKIALLRLDTDWYESTKHELKYLFPLLSPGGVLIIDDYGFWKGARKAVDEYFKEYKVKILLNRMDETGRMAIKQ